MSLSITCTLCGTVWSGDALTLPVSCPVCLTVAKEFEHGSAINVMCRAVHAANAGWWVDLETGDRTPRNVGELLMLCVSELAEAMEGHRKNLPDDKLSSRSMFEVELADCVIRIFDLAGGLGLDLGGAYREKMAYNRTRADHTREQRLKPDGKKY